jgi:FkbM family methyltransferase
MLHVVCVRFGEAFGIEYVERLHDMVRRNLPAGFAGRFVCLTDRPADLSHLAGIDILDGRLALPPLVGWWAKLGLFLPGAFPAGDRVWYFDLDTVITGPLESLFEYAGAFAILEDVYRPGGFQSAVMSWIAGPASDAIWDEWCDHGRPEPEGGDQAVIEQHWRDWLPARIGGRPWGPDFLQTLYPGRLRSYKVDCVWGIPHGTSVVFFHGRPRPHEVLTGWVPAVWQVGGGSVAELVVVGTVPQERVLANIAANMQRHYAQLAASPAHEQIALIVGGGPSLPEQLMLIAQLQRGGAIVIATNNTDRFLRERGITPNFHVMIDARPEVAEFIRPGGIKLYASMCDPTTLERAAAAGDLTIWHALTDNVDQVLGRAMLIGGGTTVGTRAMALAYVMGFRRLMLFGMDSCYREDAHHAYPQALNDGERILDAVVGGERFRAAPWMVKQADDFKEMAVALTGMGVQITVMGGGLLAAVARSMGQETVLVDGFAWPSGDIDGRPAVFETLKDLDAYIELCPQRRVAVQAGGNVGIWALELARQFEQVITFEPDPVNFACLEHNTAKAGNVYIYHAGLGHYICERGLIREARNCGASRLSMAEKGTGPLVSIMTIDSLELPVLDLLQLDVEGFELYALLGAEETIRRCRPLIVLEMKGHGREYGYTDAELEDYVRGLGYERCAVAHRDCVFQPRRMIPYE